MRRRMAGQRSFRRVPSARQLVAGHPVRLPRRELVDQRAEFALRHRGDVRVDGPQRGHTLVTQRAQHVEQLAA